MVYIAIYKTHSIVAPLHLSTYWTRHIDRLYKTAYLYIIKFSLGASPHKETLEQL